MAGKETGAQGAPFRMSRAGGGKAIGGSFAARQPRPAESVDSRRGSGGLPFILEVVSHLHGLVLDPGWSRDGKEAFYFSVMLVNALKIGRFWRFSRSRVWGG